MKNLTIFVNDKVVYEYERDSTIEEQQLAFLDKMDADLDQGIKIHGELITHPDSQQRATFVVMNLIIALQQDNTAIISASCAYLINRCPALIEAHVNDVDNSINIELIDE